MRTSKPIEVEEIGGDDLSLEVLQNRAAESLAGEMVNAIRKLLSSGVLVVQDGRVMVNGDSGGDSQEQTSHNLFVSQEQLLPALPDDGWGGGQGHGSARVSTGVPVMVNRNPGGIGTAT